MYIGGWVWRTCIKYDKKRSSGDNRNCNSCCGNSIAYKFLGNKTNQQIAVSNATVQTCSDIENIYLDLKAGNFEFRTGDSFAVDTMSAGEVKVKSYIANNTWTVEGSKTIGNNENGVVSIIIPKGFHAKKAVMKLTAGNILVSGLSADNTKS